MGFFEKLLRGVAGSHGGGHHSQSDEDRAIHQHQHNPSDYSHEKPSTPPTFTLMTRGGANQKFDDLERSLDSSPLSRLHRLPRRSSDRLIPVIASG